MASYRVGDNDGWTQPVVHGPGTGNPGPTADYHANNPPPGYGSLWDNNVPGGGGGGGGGGGHSNEPPPHDPRDDPAATTLRDLFMGADGHIYRMKQNKRGDVTGWEDLGATSPSYTVTSTPMPMPGTVTAGTG